MQARSVTGGNEGRGRLVLWSSLYGIWLGIATDILFDIDGDRAVILPPLIGMAAGLGLSLAATSNYQLTVGEAWTIITGLDYGSFNGALWAGGLDINDKGIVGAAVATSIAATSIGVLVANAKSPSAGDIELVRSSLLWGTIGGFLGTAIAVDARHERPIGAEGRPPRRWTPASSSASALANTFDLSRNRVLIIDAGALTGGLAGPASPGWSAGSDPTVRHAGRGAGRHAGGHRRRRARRRAISTTTDAARRGARAPSGARDPWRATADGRWSIGTPGAVPVFDGRGTRLIGATFNAVGGQF